MIVDTQKVPPEQRAVRGDESRHFVSVLLSQDEAERLARVVFHSKPTLVQDGVFREELMAALVRVVDQ